MTHCARRLAAALLMAWPGVGVAQSSHTAPYVYVWAGDADSLESDFLAVIDTRPGSPTYARVLSTVPVGARATRPRAIQAKRLAALMIEIGGDGHTETGGLDPVVEAAAPAVQTDCCRN